MEATRAKPRTVEALSLADLVACWSDAGASPPVAIVVSIFDDVLGSVTPVVDGDADLDVIIVDGTGQATLAAPVGLAHAGRMLASALGDDAPPAAQPLLARLDDAVDGEQLRLWMRDALGTPASHDEVRAAFAAVHERTLENADTLLPAPAPIDEDEDLETLPPEPSELPVPELAEEDKPQGGEVTLPPERKEDSEAPESIVVAAPTMIDTSAPEMEEETEGVEAVEVVEVPPVVPDAPMGDEESSTSDGRKVIRHSYRPRTVAVVAAPAARRSARAAGQGADSILVPNERKSSLPWLFALAAIGAFVYFLFFN